ncbi:hypothetical protein [Kitasatospora cineracea]|uniref:Uncharacterized protein n=1 Tax=Kitasatospora cineracea TaxID=88074 RepID=A0A8G1UMK6_9ACTN|nr:hypothetical protein [Kitasatospora cineracea]ROR46767.1 hypothetical protein EDD39_5056 [Kitasatospora cineracea]
MDDQLAALAATAATTVVSSLATDAWQQVRGLVARLWHHPDQTAAVEGELEAARTLLLGPAREEDESDLVAAWRLRFRQLLATDEAAAQALAGVVAELTAGSRPEDRPEAGVVRHVHMRATASDSAQVYQSGGDMTIGRP